MSFKAFASCVPGLEGHLQKELAPLEARGLLSCGSGSGSGGTPGGLAFEAKGEGIAAANLSLACAVRVWLRLPLFRARAFGELERKLAKLPWRDYLSAGQAWEVQAHSRRSRLRHTGALQERVEQALDQRLGPPRQGASVVRVQLRMERDEAEISIDTSGEALHRRGYRVNSWRAPLREDLARALILDADWSPERTLLDPCAGSGTIGLEALSLRLPWGKPPRDYAYRRAPWFQGGEPSPDPSPDAELGAVILRDLESSAADAVRANLAKLRELAGEGAGSLDAQIDSGPAGDLSPAMLRDWAQRAGPGAIVTNPPWGGRLHAGEARELYASLGRLAHQSGWALSLVSRGRKFSDAARLGAPYARVSAGGETVGMYRRKSRRA